VRAMYESLRADGFERRFGNLYRALLCGGEPRKASFCNLDWRFVLFGSGFFQSQPVFEKFCWASKQVGESELVVTNLSFEPRHRWSCLTSCDYQSYVDGLFAEEHGVLAAATKAMFGTTGKWAAIIDQGEALHALARYVIVSGVPTFIDTLISSQGGADCLREKFRRHLNCPYITPPIPSDVQSSLLADADW
jgi:hypothetical protein